VRPDSDSSDLNTSDGDQPFGLDPRRTQTQVVQTVPRMDARRGWRGHPASSPWANGEQFTASQGYGPCSTCSHTGYEVDFSMPQGTAVVAVYDGVVSDLGDYTGNSATGVGLTPHEQSGLYIKVHHHGRTSEWYSSYLHLKSQAVKIGDSVKTGQTIGYSGNTGYSTGPHLHFHIRNGANASAGGFRPVPISGIVVRTGETTITDFAQGETYRATGLSTDHLTLAVSPTGDQSVNAGNAGGTAVFYCLVTSGGTVVPNASIPVSDAAQGRTAVPLVTDGNGQASYTSHPLASGQVCFGPATKDGYAASSQLCRQVNVTRKKYTLTVKIQGKAMWPSVRPGTPTTRARGHIDAVSRIWLAFRSLDGRVNGTAIQHGNLDANTTVTAVLCRTHEPVHVDGEDSRSRRRDPQSTGGTYNAGTRSRCRRHPRRGGTSTTGRGLSESSSPLRSR